MARFKTVALAAAIAVGWAQTAAAADIYAKPDGTADEQTTLVKDCVAKAAKMPVDMINPYASAPSSAAAVIAVSLVAGFMNGVHESREHRRFEDRCMRKAGWARIKLTDAEEASLDKASDAGRAAWIDDFLKTDIADRVQAGLTPKAPPLPKAGAEEAVGGVLVDPAALTVTQGPVGKGQPLLTGKVAHRRTGTLREEVAIPFALGSTHALKGAVYHQVDLRPPAAAADEETSSFWCGKVKAAISGMLDECFWTDFDGYHVATLQPTLISESGYRDWLVGTPNFMDGSAKLFPGPFPLEVSDTDLLGPMDFTLKLDRIEKGGVWLAAVASKAGAGKDLPVWKGFVAIDSEGKAILPLWTHRLTLTVQGDKVVAGYTADGDGSGLAEVGRAPSKAS